MNARTEAGNPSWTPLIAVGVVAGIILAGVAVFIGVSSGGADSADDPAESFAAFERDRTSEDALPAEADQLAESEMMAIDPETSRLLDETNDGVYYLAESERDAVCLIMAEPGQEPYAGCSDYRVAMDEGVVLIVSRHDQPDHYAVALPDGYDEVVNDDGDQPGTVRNGLFTMIVNEGEDAPDVVIVRGSAGEYELDLRASAI